MTIINHRYKFIFIKTRKSAGTSLEIALSKFCNKKDIVTLIKLSDEKKRKELNFQGPTNYYYIKYFLNHKMIIQFVKDIIKILPFTKLLFKYKTSPKFNLKFQLIEPWQKYLEHDEILNVKKKIGFKKFNEYYKFTIVRHPYDKMLSHYWWQINKGEFSVDLTFYDFVKEESKKFFRSISSILNLNSKNEFDQIIKFENFEDDLQKLSYKLKLPSNLFGIFREIKAKSNTRKDKSMKLLDDKSKELIFNDWELYFKKFNYKK